MTAAEPGGMVTRDITGAAGVVLRAGVITSNGAVVLLAGDRLTVLADPATVAALRGTLDWAAAEQARIHQDLYPGEVTRPRRTLTQVSRDAEDLLRGAAFDRLPVDAGRVAKLLLLIGEAADMGERMAAEGIARVIEESAGLDDIEEDNPDLEDPVLDDEQQYAAQHAAIARGWGNAVTADLLRRTE